MVYGVPLRRLLQICCDYDLLYVLLCVFFIPGTRIAEDMNVKMWHSLVLHFALRLSREILLSLPVFGFPAIEYILTNKILSKMRSVSENTKIFP